MRRVPEPPEIRCVTRAWLVAGLLLGAGLAFPPAEPSQGAEPVAGRTGGAEAQYTGSWVCQTFMPGYNIRPYGADASQPLTNHMPGG
jgi:hypothetical protein